MYNADHYNEDAPVFSDLLDRLSDSIAALERVHGRTPVVRELIECWLRLKVKAIEIGVTVYEGEKGVVASDPEVVTSYALRQLDLEAAREELDYFLQTGNLLEESE